MKPGLRIISSSRGDLDPGVVVNRDGPQNVMMPIGRAQWIAANLVSPAWKGVPDFHQRLQMASGDAIDDVHDLEWSASGSSDYQQAVTDWDAYFVKITETNGESFGALAAIDGGAWFNTNTQSVVWEGIFKPVSSTGTRIMIMIAGADGYVALNASGRLQLAHGGGTITGGIDWLALGGEHPFIIEYGLGSGNGDHTGPGVWRLSTDKEQLVGTWQTLPDGPKGIGPVSFAGLAPPETLQTDHAIFVGSKAEAIIAAGPKTRLEAKGWTVTGY